MQKKIAFMGAPIFAVPILKNIYQNGYEVSVVYTQPPRKSNRGQKFEKSPIHLFAEINRPSTCDVEYLDYDGNKKILKAEGLLATCIQHEIDHLEGILFIDYLSKLKKTMIIKKLSKQKKSSEAVII